MEYLKEIRTMEITERIIRIFGRAFHGEGGENGEELRNKLACFFSPKTWRDG